MTINILVKICKKEMVAFLAITIENVSDSLQGVEKVKLNHDHFLTMSY